MALAALVVGAFMSALVGNVVNTILPVVTEAFGTDVATIEWVMTIYMLVQTGLMLTFGRLGDMIGYQVIYVWGFVVFVVGSALCGLAPSATFLVGSRAVQAVGASMLMATSPAILTRIFPPHQRGRVLGFQATSVYLGLACGAPLGGFLASALSWRAVFFVIVPIGLLALGLALRYIPRERGADQRERFDVAGALVYILALFLLLLALNQGHVWGWTSPAVLGCVAAGLVLLAGFAAIELRTPGPMLDLDLFRQRAFSAPVVSAVLNYMGFSATFFLVPFYLIQGRGLNAAQAGLVLMAQPIAMALAASFSGALSDRIGSRLPATAGMLVQAIGLLLLSRAGEAVPFAYTAGALAVVGFGIGLFTSPNNSAVMGAVPSRARGVASGVLATARALGQALGIGMAGAIFSTVLTASGGQDAATVVASVEVGLLAASGVALAGAIASATRAKPRPAA